MKVLSKSISALVLAAPLVMQGQPKAVEVFGTVGYLSYKQDTAFEGGALAAGGTAVLPINRYFAIEGSAQTSSILFEDTLKVRPSYTSRINLVSITPTLRLGSDRVYGFGGFGIAGAVSGRYGGPLLQGRGGVVFGMTRHLVLRGEFTIGQLHNTAQSASLGLGYRF